jgi:serine/threonine protein kinase
LITTKGIPDLKEPNKWSSEFRSFVAMCLNKEVDDRPDAVALLKVFLSFSFCIHIWVRSLHRNKHISLLSLSHRHLISLSSLASLFVEGVCWEWPSSFVRCSENDKGRLSGRVNENSSKCQKSIKFLSFPISNDALRSTRF